MMPYGERWKIHRKLCHEALNVRPTVDFDSHQYKYTHRLLAHLLEAPDRFMEEAALLVVSPHLLSELTMCLCIIYFLKLARSHHTVRNLRDRRHVSR